MIPFPRKLGLGGLALVLALGACAEMQQAGLGAAARAAAAPPTTRTGSASGSTS